VFAGPVPKEAFAALPGVSDVVSEDHVLRMRVSGPVAPVVKAAAGYDLSDFISREPTLEETFLAVYGPQGDGAEHVAAATEQAAS
jgi:ABC-2 type transport system ATP-binding protein